MAVLKDRHLRVMKLDGPGNTMSVEWIRVTDQGRLRSWSRAPTGTSTWPRTPHRGGSCASSPASTEIGRIPCDRPGNRPQGMAAAAGFVTIAIGEIPTPTARPLPLGVPHGHHRPRSRSRPLQAGLERRRGLRLPAKRGLDEDIIREMSWMKGEPDWMREQPPEELPALPASPDAQLGWRHVGGKQLIKVEITDKRK